MRMHVIHQRTELISWYRRLGYQPTGERVPFPLDEPGVIAKQDNLDFTVLAKALGGEQPPAALASVPSDHAG